MVKQIKCRVTKASWRVTQPNQALPIHLPLGKEIEVGLPLGVGEMEDWEKWLEPSNPDDRPGGAAAKKRATVPIPGQDAVDDGDGESSGKSVDTQRAELIVEASNSLDENADDGWNPTTGLMSVKYAKEYVSSKTGERNPKWVTQVLIQTLSED